MKIFYVSRVLRNTETACVSTAAPNNWTVCSCVRRCSAQFSYNRGLMASRWKLMHLNRLFQQLVVWDICLSRLYLSFQGAWFVALYFESVGRIWRSERGVNEDVETESCNALRNWGHFSPSV